MRTCEAIGADDTLSLDGLVSSNFVEFIFGLVAWLLVTLVSHKRNDKARSLTPYPPTLERTILTFSGITYFSKT